MQSPWALAIDVNFAFALRERNKLMFTRFRGECTALYAMSLAEAKRLQHAHVGVEHLALALLSDPVYPLAAALKQGGFKSQAQHLLGDQ